MSFRDQLPPDLQALLTPEIEAEVEAQIDEYGESFREALTKSLEEEPLTDEGDDEAVASGAPAEDDGAKEKSG
jgi:hypothetical protein